MNVRAVLSILLVLACAIGLLAAWEQSETPWLIFQASVAGMTGFWAARWALGRERLRPAWWLLPLCAVVSLAAVQLAAGWTSAPRATWLSLWRWFTYLSIALLASQLFANPFRLRVLLRGAVVFGLLLSMISVLQAYSGTNEVFFLFGTPYQAAYGPFLNRNFFASFIALILPMALFLVREEKAHRSLYAGAALLLYAAVIAGQSRGGTMVVTAEVLLLSILLSSTARSRRSGWTPGRVAGVVAILCLVAGLIGGWDVVASRFTTEDSNDRGKLAAATLKMIADRPVTGFGMGTWTSVYPAYALMDIGLFANAAHNDWLQWAAEGGLPLAAAFGALLLAAGAVTLRAPWAAGVIAVLMHSLVDFPMQGRFLPAIVFLVFGAAVAAAAEPRYVQRHIEHHRETGAPAAG